MADELDKSHSLTSSASLHHSGFSSLTSEADLEIGRLHTIAERGNSQMNFYDSDEDSDEDYGSGSYDDDSSLNFSGPPPEPHPIMPPEIPASPPRFDRFVNGEEEKREITLDDFDGEESSNRLATGAAIVGAGAAVVGGVFGAKVLLENDSGNQEYIDPDNYQHSSLHESFTESSSSLNAPPNQVVDATVAAGGSAAAGGIVSEVGKRVRKLLKSDDNNDIDHLRSVEKADQITGNLSTAQQTTQAASQAARAAEAAKAAKAAQ